MTTVRRCAAAGMATAALLAIAGFTALGSIFDYPGILKEPTAVILDHFRGQQGQVTAWFGVLVLSAVLLAPVGVLLGKVVGGRTGRWIAGVGVAGAVVQSIGLSRWILLIPGVAQDALDPSRTAQAHETFDRLHFWLGTILGETIGYALTAIFTVLVVRGLGRSAPRWVAVTGYAAAALIATGVVIPLGVGVASLSNFAGYVLWCLWLLVMAVVLWRADSRRPVAA